MSTDLATRRLAALDVLPETQAALIALLAHDAVRPQGAPHHGAVIDTLYTLLDGGDSATIQPFVEAWSVLMHALRHLDHLQDDDHDAVFLPTDSPAAQYNVVFSYYLLAATCLDDLEPQKVPPARLLALRRLWNETLLRAASGQQRDLALCSTTYDTMDAVALLDQYQTLAQAKTGALFLLAFGGAATLATDDAATIAMLGFAGEVYGTLLQFADDLADEHMQQHVAATLPTAYGYLAASQGVQRQQFDLAAYWQYVYAAYLAQVDTALSSLPATIRVGVRTLFTNAFK